MHLSGFPSMTSTIPLTVSQRTFAIRVHGLDWGIQVPSPQQTQHLHIEDLRWFMDGEDNTVAIVNLFPGDDLFIELGWILHGPLQVKLIKDKEHGIKAIVRRLSKKIFNIDDPLEYPCYSCGSNRHVPCEGNLENCTYRVFWVRGGKL